MGAMNGDASSECTVGASSECTVAVGPHILSSEFLPFPGDEECALFSRACRLPISAMPQHAVTPGIPAIVIQKTSEPWELSS